MKRVVLFSFFITVASAFGAPIYLMDTIEFITLHHKRGAHQYVEKVAVVLKKMKFEGINFSAAGATPEDFYKLMKDDTRWSPIVIAIDAACKEKKNRGSCLELEKIRLDTFDFIKNNPESSE